MCCGQPEVSAERRSGEWWEQVVIGPTTMRFGSREPAEAFLLQAFLPGSEHAALQAALRFQKELAEAV